MTAATDATAPLVDLGHGGGRRLWMLAVAFLGSGVLLALAEWMAARGDTRGHFYVFWVAYFLVTAPVAWHLVSSRTSSAARGALVVALGIWSLAPTLLRTGAHPLFFDEFSHFRMLQDLVRTGHPVGSVGLLQIGANFPGLELITSALYHLSGLTLWISALVIAAVAHVALLAGVYVLVRDASRSSRAGAIAAVVYSLNPSWLVFDAQFSYETIALPMLVWGLVFALRGARARGATTNVRARTVQIGLAAVLTAGLVVSHSVTSVVLTAALVGVAVVASLQRGGLLRSEVRTSLIVAWCLAGWAVLLTTWRFVDIGHPLFVYLDPTFHFSQQLRQLLGLLGIGKGLPLHNAFASSTVPFFELACAYLMLPVLVVAFVWAVWGLVGARRELSPIVYVAGVLGALFFVSLPLASAQAYSEAAHRSWAFSFLGFAVVLGVASGLALDGRVSVTLRARRLWPPPERWRRALGPLVAGCMAVVAIGGVSVGSSTAYRFGGPVDFQSDPLYVGTQTALVASWFARNATPGQIVFANRFVARPIAIASGVRVLPPGGPQVRLLLLVPPITTDVLFPFEHIGRHHRGPAVTYIVVNRFTGHVGGVKGWFLYAPSDSLLPKRERTQAYPWRFGCLDWAHAVFATNAYEVLKVDPARLAADIARSSPILVPNCPSRKWNR